MKAPKTSWNRLFVAWASGVFDRLDNAKARREAVYGRPDRALEMAFGWRTARILVVMAMKQYPNPYERIDHYRATVCRYIAPGGRSLWPDDDPLA